MTDRYQKFSSRYKGDQAKNELLDNGVVVERRVRQEKAKRKLLQLTEKGRNYVQEELDLEVNHEGRGGIVHRFWQHRIQEIFEKAGWDAFLEKFDADVYINMGNTELAIEVAMEDNPREIQHVENHVAKGFEVWIACRNQEIREGIEQRLKQNDLTEDRGMLRLLRDFSKKEVPSS